jgi:cobalt/nickel transport system permease protein
MLTFDKEYFNLGYLDSLSYKDTFIHRLDPRIKVIVAFAFIFTVVSFPKYEISGLIPFFLLPVLFFSLGNIPVKFIIKKILLVSPFAIFIGIFNPIFDTNTHYIINELRISGGWVSLLSIIIKFLLTISTALLLIATTSFPKVCYALQKLGIPDIFVSQLLFLYRYIFVLAEETMKIVRARNLRSFHKRGHGLRLLIPLMGVLFIRTIERSERIYQAMLSRGFHGKIRTLNKSGISVADVISILITLAALYFFRTYDVTGMFGNLIIRAI